MSEPRPVYKTLEELKEAAKEKFSESEIESFMNMGKSIACKPVLTMLKETIMEKGPDNAKPKVAKQLCRRIDKLFTHKDCGHVQMDFEGVPYHFGVSLSMMPRDFMPIIDVPEEYSRDVFQQFINFKATACAYWNTFSSDNANLIKDIASYCTDVDFSQLTIDERNKCQMYFDPTTKNRICVMAYYFDDSGQIIFKTPAEFLADAN